MVVEVILCFWVGGHIHFLVLDQLPNIRPQELERASFSDIILGLLTVDGFRYHVGDGYGWIPLIFLVCSLPVFLGEVGLKAESTYDDITRFS